MGIYEGRRLITVPKELLNLANSDDEIAFNVASSLGGIISEHSREKSNLLAKLILQSTPWSPLVAPPATVLASNFGLRGIWLEKLVLITIGLITLPINLAWRRNRQTQQFEADYIGLLLMADAGYNPPTAAPIIQCVGSAIEEISKQDRSNNLRDRQALTLNLCKIYSTQQTTES